MEGYRTIAVAFVGSLITLLAAFGLEVSEAQRDAILGVLLATWPVAMVVMRLVTKTPVKIPGAGGGNQDGRAHTAVLTALLVLALGAMAVTGCQSGGIRSFSDGVGATYLAIDTAAEVIFDSCRNEVVDGPCAPDSLISTEDKDRAKAALSEALMTLNVARDLYQTGSTDLAMDRLRQARQLLAVAEAIARRADQ